MLALPRPLGPVLAGHTLRGKGHERQPPGWDRLATGGAQAERLGVLGEAAEGEVNAKKLLGAGAVA